MFQYTITTYTLDGEVKARISYTTDEGDINTARAEVTLDEKAKIVRV